MLKMHKFIDLLKLLDVHNTVVGTQIHPSDNMCSTGRESHYYDVGRDALWNIIQSMMAAGIYNPSRILDFPSGFGRVTRYIRSAFPNITIDVGDIWDEAVNYTSTEFSANKIKVDREFTKINAQKYDVIFCGSLLTHLPEHKGIELLEFFREHLTIGGIMIVTCCGRKNLQHEFSNFNSGVFGSLENLQKLNDEYYSGLYAFTNYPGQIDYGRSFTPISWFHSYVANKDDLIISRFSERGWDNNQDVLTLKRVI